MTNTLEVISRTLTEAVKEKERLILEGWKEVGCEINTDNVVVFYAKEKLG